MSWEQRELAHCLVVYPLNSVFVLSHMYMYMYMYMDLHAHVFIVYKMNRQASKIVASCPAHCMISFPLQVFRKQQSKQKLRTLTLHCHDVRVVKLIFTMEDTKKITSISAIPEIFPERVGGAWERNEIFSVPGRQFGQRLKSIASPAIPKKIKHAYGVRGCDLQAGGWVWFCGRIGLRKRIGSHVFAFVCLFVY